MKIKRLLALVVCAVIILTFFVSCEELDEQVLPKTTIDEEVNSAIVKTASLLHKATIAQKINLNTENETVENILAQKNGENVVFVDGKNIYTETEQNGVVSKAIFYDGVMYMDVMGMKYKYEVPLEEAEQKINDIISSYDATALKEANFESVLRTVGEDGSVTVTYEKSTKDVDGIFGDIFASIAEVSVDNDTLKYIVIIDSEGRLASVTSYMNIVVMLNPVLTGDTTVSIEASVEQITEYDYDDVMTVTAPENADEYVGMNLGDLFG